MIQCNYKQQLSELSYFYLNELQLTWVDYLHLHTSVPSSIYSLPDSPYNVEIEISTP